MAYVYRHIRKDTNEIFYIGIGKTKIRMKSTNNRNKHWFNIVNKTDFIAEIIEDNLNWEQACEREKYWISLYGRRDLNTGSLVNMTDGGDGVSNPSLITRNKISISNIGKKHSDETKAKIKDKRKNQIFSDEFKKRLKSGLALGQHHTDETKEKIRIGNVGKVRTDITKQRIRAAKLKMSDDTKEKMRVAQLGKVVSDETRLKLSNATKLYWENKRLNKTII